jgi:hypothetical protein
MFFQKNTQALLKAKPQYQNFVNSLATVESISEFELLETAQGDYTLHYKGIFLHDPQGAEQEAKNVVQKYCQQGSDRVHILLGLGLGYLLQEVFDGYQGHIVIYEPDLPLLRFVLDNVDLSAFLGSGRVWIESYLEDLIETLRPLFIFADQLDMLLLKGYAPLFSNELQNLTDALYEAAEHRIIDYSTVNHFHTLWIEEFFTNLPYFANMISLDELAGQLEGKPALLISSGPSLDNALEDIRALKDAVNLIAVGGALRCLHQVGIVPDFALFCDAVGMQEQLTGLPEEFLNQICFVVLPVAQTVCVSFPARKHILMLAENGKEYGDWLDQALGKKHLRLPGGGTVSIYAFQLAIHMGCDPIILVGQDLALPNYQIYSGGITVELDKNGKGVLQKSDTLYEANYEMTQVLGQNGEMLPSTKAYASFLQHLEDLAAANYRSKVPKRLINASIGGAHIEGFELSPLSQIQPSFSSASGWKQRFFTALLSDSCRYEERSKKLFDKLNKLEIVTDKALSLVQQLTQHSNQNHEQRVQQWMDYLNAEPMIKYFMQLETIKYQRALRQPNAEFALLSTEWIDKCSKMLREQILPNIQRAKAAFNHQSTAA